MLSTWQARASARSLAAAAGCGVFSAVYESMSHGVYSPYMVFLFLVPLLVGGIPSLVCLVGGFEPGWVSRQLWACAVLTLSLGCCFAGVLEIYGTTSPYPLIYVGVGLFFLVLATASAALGARRPRRAARLI